MGQKSYHHVLKLEGLFALKANSHCRRGARFNRSIFAMVEAWQVPRSFSPKNHHEFIQHYPIICWAEKWNVW